MKINSAKKMTTIAILSAMAVVLSLFIRVPLVPAVPFLTYDPKDVVIGVGGLLLGPVSAFLISMISSFLEILISGGNLIDVLMNVLSTCAFICTASWIYRKKPGFPFLVLGLIIGTLVSSGIMVLWNYVVTPFYYGMPRATVAAMLPAIALFNLLKDGINTGVLILIYKPVVMVLSKSKLAQASAPEQVSNKKAALIALVFLAVTFIAALACLALS